MKLRPDKFLCKYELKTGAVVVGIVMCCIFIACCIASIVQIVMMRDCSNCRPAIWRNAYAMSITSSLYCFIMLAFNFWFLWGVGKAKTSVVLSWVVVTALWLMHGGVLLIVLLCLYWAEVHAIAWLMSLVFSIIGYAMLLYGFTIVYSFYFKLKEEKREANASAN